MLGKTKDTDRAKKYVCVGRIYLCKNARRCAGTEEAGGVSALSISL